MKADALLARNWLRGEIVNAVHAVLCGAGHNLRMILAYLQAPLFVACVVWLAVVTRSKVTPAVPILAAQNSVV